MAAVTKCDRCGTIYNKDDGQILDGDERNPFHHVKVVGSRDVLRWVDLCNNCLKKFLTWIDGELDDEKE